MRTLLFIKRLANKPVVLCAAGLLLCLLLPTRLASSAIIEVLFVGNSYTHGRNEPVYSYNNGVVADANGTNQGGIPGIFKKLTTQAGLTYDVTIEAVSAQTLTYHFNDQSAVIGASNWDVVVLQEQSTRPVPASRGGNPSGFQTAVTNLSSLIASNSNANVFLYETWARPDLVIPSGQVYFGSSLSEMQNDLRDGYHLAAVTNGLSGVAPVGDAFMRAIADGVADGNPYDGISANKLNLWDTDNTHPSKYGAYLSATVLFHKITGVDPRSLSVGSGSAAEGLSISSADANVLNQVAYLTVVPEPSALMLLGGALVSFAVMRRRQ